MTDLRSSVSPCETVASVFSAISDRSLATKRLVIRRRIDVPHTSFIIDRHVHDLVFVRTHH